MANPIFRTALGYLRLVRVPALSVLALSILVVLDRVSHISFGRIADTLPSPILIYAAAFVLNDAVDAEMDTVNLPHRPIPSGAVKRESAFRLAWCLHALAIGVAATSSSTTLTYILVSSVLSVLYSIYLKQIILAKNVLAAGMSNSVFIYLAFELQAFDLSMYLFASFSLLSFGREIIMDSRDFIGDRASGLSTLSTRLGVHTATAIGLVLIGAGMIYATFLPPPNAATTEVVGLVSLTTIATWIAILLASRTRRLWLIGESTKVYVVALLVAISA